MNKKIILLISLFILVLGLVACSGAKSSVSTGTSTTPAKEFTLSELSLFNGQNGAKSYVAVDGIVYDVSDISKWRNGSHEGNTAGTDLSEAINKSPHGKAILKQAVVVGKLRQ